MPHLSKLANQYGDKVTFVAVSDEPRETVAEFLEKPSRVEGKTWGQAMEFTVATDPDLSTKKAIFSASGQRGIPSTFIIHNGVIEWIGHPMNMDEPLKKVVDGTWDRTAYRKEYEQKVAAQRVMNELRAQIKAASQEGDWERAVSLYDRAIKKYPNSGLQMQKWTMLLTEAHRD
ncbi:MAG: hypothetical protein V3T77_11575, partial [Planctomycetota bacterium]